MRSHRASLIPPEPLAADPDVIHMVIRVPNGERLERRFRGSDKLEVCIGRGWGGGLGGSDKLEVCIGRGWGGGLGGQEICIGRAGEEVYI